MRQMGAHSSRSWRNHGPRIHHSSHHCSRRLGRRTRHRAWPAAGQGRRHAEPASTSPRASSPSAPASPRTTRGSSTTPLSPARDSRPQSRTPWPRSSASRRGRRLGAHDLRRGHRARSRRTSTSTCSSSRSPMSASRTSTSARRTTRRRRSSSRPPHHRQRRDHDRRAQGTPHRRADRHDEPRGDRADQSQPTAGAQVFNTNDDAKLALESGTVDAIVVDLPTAFYLTGVELTDGIIIGQLPATTARPAMSSASCSPRTARSPRAVTAAVDALQRGRHARRLADEWLADAADARRCCRLRSRAASVLPV